MARARWRGGSRTVTVARTALGLCVAAVGATCSGVGAPEAPPNIVLIVSDDHGWTDYGFMGHAVANTPALDRLATQSMVYTRGYVPTPVCRPSLATLATGLYPHQHGITGNDPPATEHASSRDPIQRAAMERVFARQDNVIELLGRSGYVSHQSGKWWEGNPKDHGFTKAMTHGDVTRRGRHGDRGLRIGREGLRPIFDFIESSDPAPFFVWYAPFLPHTPHDPPKRLLAKYLEDGLPERVAKYYAMVEWLDETVGQLVGYLDENGLRENTAILYVADNGWIPAEQADQQAKTRAKMSPYDMGVRSPVMVNWPGRVAPGRDDETLVSSVDFVPTMLRMAGVEPPPDGLPGIDLLDREALAARGAVYGATYAHTSVNLERPVANLKYRSVVRADGWKLILPYKPNEQVVLMIRGTQADWMSLEPELYRLSEDPHETEDLAAERPEVVADLRASLQDWWPVPE